MFLSEQLYGEDRCRFKDFKGNSALSLAFDDHQIQVHWVFIQRYFEPYERVTAALERFLLKRETSIHSLSKLPSGRGCRDASLWSFAFG